MGSCRLLFFFLIQCSIVSLHLNYTCGFPVIKKAEHANSRTTSVKCFSIIHFHKLRVCTLFSEMIENDVLR